MQVNYSNHVPKFQNKEEFSNFLTKFAFQEYHINRAAQLFDKGEAKVTFDVKNGVITVEKNNEKEVIDLKKTEGKKPTWTFARGLRSQRTLDASEKKIHLLAEKLWPELAKEVQPADSTVSKPNAFSEIINSSEIAKIKGQIREIIEVASQTHNIHPIQTENDLNSAMSDFDSAFAKIRNSTNEGTIQDLYRFIDKFKKLKTIVYIQTFNIINHGLNSSVDLKKWELEFSKPFNQHLDGIIKQIVNLVPRPSEPTAVDVIRDQVPEEVKPVIERKTAIVTDFKVDHNLPEHIEPIEIANESRMLLADLNHAVQEVEVYLLEKSMSHAKKESLLKDFQRVIPDENSLKDMDPTVLKEVLEEKRNQLVKMRQSLPDFLDNFTKDPSDKFKGIENFNGVTCWLNASLQTLAHTSLDYILWRDLTPPKAVMKGKPQDPLPLAKTLGFDYPVKKIDLTKDFNKQMELVNLEEEIKKYNAASDQFERNCLLQKALRTVVFNLRDGKAPTQNTILELLNLMQHSNAKGESDQFFNETLKTFIPERFTLEAARIGRVNIANEVLNQTILLMNEPMHDTVLIKHGTTWKRVSDSYVGEFETDDEIVKEVTAVANRVGFIKLVLE